MQSELENRSQNDLAQWGLWGRPQYLPGYTSAGSDEVKLDVLGNALDITDDYAQHLDSVISGLKFYDAKAYETAKLFFIHGKSYRQIAVMIDVNKAKVGPLLDAAVSWVARGLYDAEIKKAA
ncbi:MAG: hypothetical protein MK214_15065 [Thalassotalea sp.]|nr:hypothetical protein [Thalassotalea sp.]